MSGLFWKFLNLLNQLVESFRDAKTNIRKNEFRKKQYLPSLKLTMKKMIARVQSRPLSNHNVWVPKLVPRIKRK